MNQQFREAVNYLIDRGIVSNQSDLANRIGISRAYLSQVMSGTRDLSESIIEKMSEVFPELSFDKKMKQETGTDYIPILPIYARGGSLADWSMGVNMMDCERAISPIAGADMIIPVFGDSMAPEYPSGSMLVVKKINDQAFIEWGKVYVLDTVNGPIVKEIRRGDKEGEFICNSLNPDPKFAPFTVRRVDIIGIYRVLMCMALK